MTINDAVGHVLEDGVVWYNASGSPNWFAPGTKLYAYPATDTAIMTSTTQPTATTTEALEPPISPLLRDSGDPEWLQIANLFFRHLLASPPIRLRDELSNMLAWARYGEAVAALSTAPAGDGAADTLAAKDTALAEMRVELEAAKHELSCCDDIPLDQGLVGGISALQADREYLRPELKRVKLALKPFAGDKLPSSRRIKIAYNRYGLRCAMSDLEIAQDAAARALASQDEGEGR